MEPLNDDELNQLLMQWEAPRVPAELRPPQSRWRWLLTGTIRVPVPAGFAVVVIMVLLVYWAVSASRPPRTVTLADFEPVKQLQPRIIRSQYEGK
jgi:hypothetical protein